MSNRLIGRLLVGGLDGVGTVSALPARRLGVQDQGRQAVVDVLDAVLALEEDEHVLLILVRQGLSVLAQPAPVGFHAQHGSFLRRRSLPVISITVPADSLLAMRSSKSSAILT